MGVYIANGANNTWVCKQALLGRASGQSQQLSNFIDGSAAYCEHLHTTPAGVAPLGHLYFAHTTFASESSYSLILTLIRNSDSSNTP